jgi:hypothetical protein
MSVLLQCTIVAVTSDFWLNMAEDPSMRRGMGEVFSQTITPHHHCVNRFKKTSSNEGWTFSSRCRLSKYPTKTGLEHKKAYCYSKRMCYNFVSLPW